MADYYPAGMTECFGYGLSGNCGVDCPVFQMGGCEWSGEEDGPERSEEPVLAWQKWGF